MGPTVQQQIRVVIPEGAAPGGKIMAQAPSGQQIQVIIPPGKSPGDEILVEFDSDPTLPLPPPAQAQPTSYPVPDYAADGMQVPQAQMYQQPQVVMLNPANQVQGPPGSTLVYDGNGNYIHGYNVSIQKHFGSKSVMWTAVFCCIFPPLGCCMPLCPQDEIVTGTTAEGNHFRIER